MPHYLFDDAVLSVYVEIYVDNAWSAMKRHSNEGYIPKAVRLAIVQKFSVFI